MTTRIPRSGAPTATLTKPTRRPRIAETPVTPRRGLHIPSRVGSSQRVSERGRRIKTQKTDPRKLKFLWLVIVVLAGGVLLVLGMTGVTARQTFAIHVLNSQSRQLDDQLESLRRDVASADSAAEIARRAADMGMVVAVTPGVLNVGDDGRVTEVRKPDPRKTMPIIDINGKRVRPSRASSDPQLTAQVGSASTHLPKAPSPVAKQIPAIAPYAPNIRSHTASGAAQ